MITYVLDSSALLRYIDDEAGSGRVEAILATCIAGTTGARISAIQWGEIAGKLRSHHGARQQEHVLSSLPTEIEIVPATAERAVRAAELRVDHKISFADAFAMEITMQSAQNVLVTADYDFKPVADLAKIEFLPRK